MNVESRDDAHDVLYWLTKIMDDKRQNLAGLVKKYGDINHPLVIHASEELDYYVFRLQKMKMKEPSKRYET